MSHIPVMLDYVVEHMAPKDGDIIVDGTFGGGGYTKALLEHANCQLIAIDRDPHAISRSEPIKSVFAERFEILEGPFGDMDVLLEQNGVSSVDGVVLDLGVSSFQLDQGERGFSFMRDGPLDMRMSISGPSAADIVRNANESDLADIIYQLGEEKDSRRIARRIVEARKVEDITTTLQLAEVIEAAVGGRKGKRTHPATKAFQALRMFVNDELGELARALVAAERVLKPGGRLVIVTFHSLEDRMVKSFMSARSGKISGGSRFMPEMAETGPKPTFERMKRISAPETAEVAANARARSSRLRSAVRTDKPVWADGFDADLDLPSIEEIAS